MGQTLGDFQILGELGRGAMGVVYRARHPERPGDVALKVMGHAAAASPGSLGRFERECQAASRLNHPNIVRVLGLGTDGQSPYMALELVEGEDLDEVLRKHGPLPPRRAAKLGIQLAAALSHAHSLRVLHRDLKPANVMLHDTRGALLTDFGLAKVFGSQAGPSLTRSSDLLGSPFYMAPEAASMQHDRVGACTDVYGLGAILYEMLTAEAPFRGTSLHEVLIAVTTRPVEPPSAISPAVSPELDAIVQKCMAKAPDDRYATVAEVGEALRAYRVNALRKPAKVPVGALVGGAVVVAALAVGLGVLVVGSNSAQPAPVASAGEAPQAPLPPVDLPAVPDVEPPAATATEPTDDELPSPLPVDDRSLFGEVPNTEALEDFLASAEEVVARAPGMPRAYVDVARVHLGRGDTATGLEAVERALLLDDRLGAAYRVRGMLRRYAQPPQADAAAADFETALDLDPADWQALRERGMLRMSMGDPAGARSDFDASIARRPSAAVYNALGALEATRGDLPKAEANFVLALELDRYSPVALQNLSQFAYQRAAYRQAADYMERYLDLNPGDVYILEMLLEAYTLLTDYEGMIRAAEALEVHAPEMTKAPLRRAAALIETGRVGSGYDVIVGVLERHPNDVAALMQLGGAQYRLEAWGGLIETCDRILAMGTSGTAREQVERLRAIAVERSR